MTAEQLLEEFRRKALALKAGALRDAVLLWTLLDPSDLNRSWPPVLRALEALAQEARAGVVTAASEYLRAVALLDGDIDDLAVRMADVADPAALRTSLTVTGPVAVQSAEGAGASSEAALARGLTAVSGAIGRVVLNGGRQTVIDTAEAGRIRWMRVTRGKTCAFCAMLASRGPVYTSAAKARDARGRPARFHDHCDCMIVPVFERTIVPESTVRYEELWISSTVGLGGQEARSAFRSAYEAVY